MVDMSFSMTELELFLLVFVRIASFVFVAPFFSTRGVPNMVKIALSVFVAYVMYNFGVPHELPEFGTVWGYAAIVLKEVSVGLIIGLSSQLCTSIVLFAGRIIDMEIGMSMASVFDPTTNEQSSITGVILQYGTLLMFYITGLHRFFLQALMETYTLIPIAGVKFNTDKLLTSLITFLSDYITIGFRICLPVFATITLMNVVLGLLAKLAPQMNMFSVGIQLKLLAGLGVLLLAITMLPVVASYISDQMRHMIVSMVEGMM